MISFVRGTLEEYTEDGIVVEAGGIGYAITTPPRCGKRCRPPGKR